MANTNQPFGFRCIGLNNAPATFANPLRPFKIAQADTVKAFKGDVLYNLGTGFVRAATGTPGGIAASQVVGIFQSCSYFSVSQGKTVNSMYWPGADAGGDVTAYCVPLIGGTPVLVVAQALLTSFTAAQKGALFDMTYAAGTAYSGWARSGMTVSAATVGTTVTLPWRLQYLWSELSPRSANGADNTSNYNWGVFSFNSAAETGTTLI